jgi:hypothetical protein
MRTGSNHEQHTALARGPAAANTPSVRLQTGLTVRECHRHHDEPNQPGTETVSGHPPRPPASTEDFTSQVRERHPSTCVAATQ